MRRAVAAVLCVLTAAVCCCLCHADSEFYEDNFRSEWDEWRGVLTERLPDGASIEDPEDAAQSLGSVWSLSDWLKRAADAVFSFWSEDARLLCELLAVLLVSALFYRLRDGLGASDLGSVFSLCTGLALCVEVTDALGALLTSAQEFLAFLASLCGGVAPLACAVTAAGGQISFSAVLNGSLALLYTIFQNVSAWLLLPVVRVILAWSIVCGVSQSMHAEGIVRCVRRVFTWGLAVLALLLGFVISVQSVVARSADTLTIRTVRFALGNLIPLIGGALSETLTTTAGSLRVIRTACGTLSMAAVVCALMPLVVRLILTHAVLGLGQGAAELIGCEREGKMLGEFGTAVGYMLALCALGAMLMILVLALLCGMSGGT
jgi:stage III sporulation protein AE